MNMINLPSCRPFSEAGHLSQISAYYEEERNTMWMLLHAHPRPCFNLELIENIMTLAQAAKESKLPFDFWVTGSVVPNMFNVGGDLNFFAHMIKNRKREALMAYARACVDCVHAASRGFDIGAISIAMIEGSALGGGVEAALAHHFVLAQTTARMGFPEIAFNLLINNIFNQEYVSNGYTYSYYYRPVGSNENIIKENFYYPQAGINFLTGITLKF